MRREVLIREVGPRDGYQNENRFIPTAMKLDFIEMLAAAGVPWMEVTSFVSPKWVPQLSDAADVMSGLENRDLGETEVVAFVPNGRGLQRASECGVVNVTTALTVSDELNLANFNKDTDEMLEALPGILTSARAMEIDIEVTVGTAFGDLGDDTVTIDRVVEVTTAVAEMGVDSISLGDTVGVANPLRVAQTYARLREAAPNVTFAAHFHDTRGLGIANVLAAWQEGVRVFDSSYGGLGGCPFAPGASGNVATEIVVYMFEQMGVSTGIDLQALLRTARFTNDFLDRTPSPATLALAGHGGG